MAETVRRWKSHQSLCYYYGFNLPILHIDKNIHKHRQWFSAISNHLVKKTHHSLQIEFFFQNTQHYIPCESISLL